MLRDAPRCSSKRNLSGQAKKIFEGRANSFGYCGWHERRKDEASSNRALQFGYARQQGEGRKVMEKI